MIEADALELNMATVEIVKMVKNPISITLNNLINTLLPTIPVVQFMFGKTSYMYNDLIKLVSDVLEPNVTNEYVLKTLIDWIPRHRKEGDRYEQLAVPQVAHPKPAFAYWQQCNIKVVNWNVYKWLDLDFIPEKIVEKINLRFDMPRREDQLEQEFTPEKAPQFSPERVEEFETSPVPEEDTEQDDFDNYYNQTYIPSGSKRPTESEEAKPTSYFSKNAMNLLEAIQGQIQGQNEKLAKRRKLQDKKDA